MTRSTFACLLTLTGAAAPACGTAVYTHSIEVSVSGASAADVGVFDHQQGYSREWAHRAMAPAGAAPYVGSITTTPAVTIGTVDTPRPVTIALAVPAITDAGYFLFTVEAPLERERRLAQFCEYGSYMPVAGSPIIPLTVSAKATGGVWHVKVFVDLPAAQSVLSRGGSASAVDRLPR